MDKRVLKFISILLSLTLALPLPLYANDSKTVSIIDLQRKLEAGEISLNQFYVEQLRQYVLVAKKLKQELYNENSFSSPVSIEKVDEVSTKLLQLKSHFEQTLAAKKDEDFDGYRFADTVDAFFMAAQLMVSIEARMALYSNKEYRIKDIKPGDLAALSKKWSITIPNGKYYWVYDSISQVPRDMEVSVTKAHLEQDAPTQLSLNLKAIWSRYIEALSSISPQLSYLDLSKCWLSIINITKYGESLEALGKDFSKSNFEIRDYTEAENKILAEKGITLNVLKPVCLGLNHEEMFAIALEMSKGGSQNSNITAKDVMARELFKEAIQPTLGEYISAANKKLAQKYVFHPKVAKRTTALEAMSYLILEPSLFVDLNRVINEKSTNSVQANSVWMKSMLEDYIDESNGVADLYLSLTEFRQLEVAFLEAARLFRDSQKSRYFNLASHDNFKPLLLKSLEESPELFNQKPLSQDFDLRLMVSEVYNYQYALEFYVNSFPYPLTQLLEGEYTKADGYLIAQIHYLVKSLSLQFVGQDVLRTRFDYEGKGQSDEYLPEQRFMLAVELETESSDHVMALATAVTSTEHFSNDYYSSNPMIQFWFEKIKEKIIKIAEVKKQENESKYQSRVVTAAVSAGAVMDPTRVGDRSLSVNPEALFKAASHFMQISTMEKQLIDHLLQQQASADFSGGHEGTFTKQKEKFKEIIDFYKSEHPTIKKESTNMFARLLWGNKSVSDEAQKEYNNLEDLYVLMGFNRQSRVDGAGEAFGVIETDIKTWFDKHHHKEKYEAFVYLYRFYLRQSYVAQYKILDLPVKDSVSDKLVPLYMILARDGSFEKVSANQSAWIKYAASEVQTRLVQQMNIISGAEKADDLSLFIAEASILNRVYGEPMAADIKATIKLNSETIFKEFDSYTMFHSLAHLHYHQKIQEQMKAKIMLGHEKITMAEHAFFAPIIGDLGIAFFGLLAEAIGPAFKPVSDFFSQVFNSQEDHITSGQSFGYASYHGSRASIGFLEVWVLSRILPFKFAKPIRRFSAANSAVVAGHMKWFIPVIGGSLIYKNFFYRPTLEEKYAELNAASFTEVQAGIHSFVTIEEQDSNQLSYRGELRAIVKENYMHGVFLGAMIVTAPVSMIWQRLKYNELPSQKIKSMNTAKDRVAAVVKEQNDLGKMVKKHSKKFELEFYDLRLSRGDWNPNNMLESINKFRKSTIYTELEKANAEVAYRTLISHLNENINLYSEYQFLMNMRAKAFWGEVNQGFVTSVERQIIELSKGRVF